MRQYGECLHACPSGYYGMRGTEINMCSSKILHLLTFTNAHTHTVISNLALNLIQ